MDGDPVAVFPDGFLAWRMAPLNRPPEALVLPTVLEGIRFHRYSLMVSLKAPRHPGDLVTLA